MRSWNPGSAISSGSNSGGSNSGGSKQRANPTARSLRTTSRYAYGFTYAGGVVATGSSKCNSSASRRFAIASARCALTCHLHPLSPGDEPLAVAPDIHLGFALGYLRRSPARGIYCGSSLHLRFLPSSPAARRSLTDQYQSYPNGSGQQNQGRCQNPHFSRIRPCIPGHEEGLFEGAMATLATLVIWKAEKKIDRKPFCSATNSNRPCALPGSAATRRTRRCRPVRWRRGRPAARSPSAGWPWHRACGPAAAPTAGRWHHRTRWAMANRCEGGEV